MAGPNTKRIAQLLRMLGSSGGERRTAWNKLMQSEGFSWTDAGDGYEQLKDGKYTEVQMQEFGQAMRAEGVEAGIKIGQARANGSGKSNGHFTLPRASEMAQFCHDRSSQLGSDWERDFASDLVLKTRNGRGLTLRTLGMLAKLYIQNGGKT